MRREFPTLTTLESYVKRMVANAKQYNERGSEIFCDAERIRKVLCAFMKPNNPAYRNPNYSAFPTPLPNENGENDNDIDADGEDDPELMSKEANESLGRSRRPQNGSQTSSAKPNGRGSTTPVVSNVGGESFVGKTMQQAQEMILAELIELKDEE
jgi:hypothetical protein